MIRILLPRQEFGFAHEATEARRTKVGESYGILLGIRGNRPEAIASRADQIRYGNA